MPEPQVVPKLSVLYPPQNMRGIEALKKVFRSELNYDRAIILLSYKGWGEPASATLAQDPMFITVVRCPDLLHSWVMQNRPDSASAYSSTIRPTALKIFVRCGSAAGIEMERTA